MTKTDCRLPKLTFRSSTGRPTKHTSVPRILLVPRILFAGIVLFALSVEADAQGTTVQLPSFYNFSYSSSVLVPDSGSAALSGLSGGYQRTTQVRPFAMGAPGANSQSLDTVSQAQTRVYVIDHEQWDRNVLGATPEEFLRNYRASNTPDRSPLKKEIARTFPSPRGKESPPSNSDAADANALGKRLVRLGRLAADRGSVYWTNYYYLTAQKHLDSELAQLANEEHQKQLDRLAAAATSR